MRLIFKHNFLSSHAVPKVDQTKGKVFLFMIFSNLVLNTFLATLYINERWGARNAKSQPETVRYDEWPHFFIPIAGQQASSATLLQTRAAADFI